jgi:phage shock protein A
MNDRERKIAICEAEEIDASDAYFAARPSIDRAEIRVVFGRAFEKAWNKQQSTIDALQARIAELEKDAGRLRKHIQQVAETHEEMRVKWHKLSLTPFDTEENKTIVLQRVKEQKLLRDIHLAAIDAAIAKENNG